MLSEPYNSFFWYLRFQFYGSVTFKTHPQAFDSVNRFDKCRCNRLKPKNDIWVFIRHGSAKSKRFF